MDKIAGYVDLLICGIKILAIIFAVGINLAYVYYWHKSLSDK